MKPMWCTLSTFRPALCAGLLAFATLGAQNAGQAPEGATPPKQHTFSGTSKAGNFEEALDAAVRAAETELNQGKADIRFEWELVKLRGVRGGIAGSRELSVDIQTRP